MDITPTRGKRSRKFYSTDFKAKVVALCIRRDRSISSIAREYDIHLNLLFRWIHEAKSRPLVQPASPSLLPIVVDHDVSRSGSCAQEHRGEDCPIVLQAGAHRVFIRGNPDLEALRLILERVLQ